MDSESGTLDVVRDWKIGALFKWECAELINEVVDVIRRETEWCDSLQAFQLK